MVTSNRIRPSLRWSVFTWHSIIRAVAVTERKQELLWMERMWGHLHEEKLTEYDTDEEYNAVVGRFIVLGYMYNLFYWFAYGQSFEPETYYDGFRFEIPIFRGKFPAGKSWESIIADLVHQELDTVYESLMRYYKNQTKALAKERGQKNTFDVIWFFMDDLYSVLEDEEDWDDDEDRGPWSHEEALAHGYDPSTAKSAHWDDSVYNLIRNGFAY